MNTQSLKLNNQSILFKIVELEFHAMEQYQPYLKLRGKNTLSKVVSKERYSHLKTVVYEKYATYKDTNLIDFLKILIDKKDNFYEKFLNPNGDKNYCNFSIQEHLNDKGIYCFIVDGNIQYVGRCTNNFNERINIGYGNISPKNCFIDGQSTNCHINSCINSAKLERKNIALGIYVMENNDEIKQLESSLLKAHKETLIWNKQKQ